LRPRADRPQPRFQKTWTYEPTDLCSPYVPVLALLCTAYTECSLYVLTNIAERSTQPRTCIDSSSSLLDFDGDSIGVVAADGAFGSYLDKFEERSEWLIELVVCGIERV